MPIVPFITRIPDAARRELFSLPIYGRGDLPEGRYDFLESYCDEPDCDCRRVIVAVLQPQTGWNTVWATINYGWESLAFYRAWGGPGLDPAELKGPFLDPLNAQSRHAGVLLDLFRELIEQPEYVALLKRHYAMFRAAGRRAHRRS